MINFTPIARRVLSKRVRKAQSWNQHIEDVQSIQLKEIVRPGRRTRFGSEHVMNSVIDYQHFVRQIPVRQYEDFRPYIMRMIEGKPNILWPGVVRRYAQSSGTSGGKSKYIPLTDDSLKLNHYAGTRDVVAHYLNLYPDSRLFTGKSLILGGSYANELSLPPEVRVGDLSASLIDNMPPFAARFRVPEKEVALMENWTEKLPALIDKSIHEDITNISGVPSWFLTVLKGVVARAGANTIHDVWPHLEVFFHGGISFAPYRDEYAHITDPAKMRYLETYNASEGFFATQSDIHDPAMLLLLDIGVFYEFLPLEYLENPMEHVLPPWEVKVGETYALIITACNGLWRYLIGDTVKVESVSPLKITIAGRIKSYINTFGEELMVHNADAAMEKACRIHHCTMTDYTAAPVYTTDQRRGCHEWWIEWAIPPANLAEFAYTLDVCLQQENSDYQAKRQGNIFLDPPIVVSSPYGLFNHWLASTGKLGGQRKVPRLLNDRHVVDFLRQATGLPPYPLNK